MVGSREEFLRGGEVGADVLRLMRVGAVDAAQRVIQAPLPHLRAREKARKMFTNAARVELQSDVVFHHGRKDIMRDARGLSFFVCRQKVVCLLKKTDLL